MSKYLEVNNNKGVIIDDNTEINTIVPYNPTVDTFTEDGQTYSNKGIIEMGDIVGYYGIGRLMTTGPYLLGRATEFINSARLYLSELESDTLESWSKVGASYRPSTSNKNMKITGNLKRPNEMRTTPLRYFAFKDDNSTGNVGLQAFDESGKLIFDSNKHYTSVIDVINFNKFSGDYNKEYKYDVPIIIIPVSLSSWFQVRYSKGSAGLVNRSIIKKTFVQQTSPYSFNIGVLEKSCDFAPARDNQYDTNGQGNTSILVIDATSVFSQLEK
jgi:hypothetical protein